MHDFEFSMPTRVYFGKGQEEKTGKLLKGYGDKILFVYGSERLFKISLGPRIKASIEKEDIEVVLFGGVVPNPLLSHVKEGIELCRDKQIEAILAVGGGSVIDTAKAIALGACYEGSVWDAYEGNYAPKKALPVGAVVTMAATASETNGLSVITEDKSHRKRMGCFEVTKPRFAILNPELTCTVPAYQTKIGAFDIFSHAFERYFDLRRESGLLDAMTESLMRTVIKCLPEVLEDPWDHQARAELMWAATIAHNDMIGTGGDFACHEISHVLTDTYGIAHGAALAMILPAWCELMLEHHPARFAAFAAGVWEIPQGRDNVSMALEGIQAMKEFIKAIGLPRTYKTSETDLESLAEKTAGPGGYVGGGFKKLYKADIVKIYEKIIR